MTEFLLLKNANIDVRTIGENQAPIHYAAKKGATKSLRVLLGFNADINSLDSKQRTPLQLAAEWTRGKAAEVLLDEGAASCLLDSSGNTALAILIDRLPNLALEALNQLHTTDVITMKEFYYLQFLEQPPPQNKEMTSMIDITEQDKTPATGVTITTRTTPTTGTTPATETKPTTQNAPTPEKTPTANGKRSAKGKTLLLTAKSSVRTPLEMAVITRKFEVVTHPVMQRLIHNKWMQYGRLSTIIDLLFHVVYGILWTTGCMSTPDTGKAIYEPFDSRIWLKVLGLILMIMTFYDIVRQIHGKSRLFFA